jgi:hypothetical protein
MADKGTDIPKEVTERVERGKEHIRQDTLVRNECVSMWRGDQYVYRSSEGYLVKQGTVQGSKPRHRPRTTRNLIHGLVEGKVSAAVQRIPSYEIVPSTSDPEDIGAARLAEKIALSGFESWKVRRHAKKVITNAIVMDGGFAMPYWDSSVPPILDEKTGIGVGDVRIRTFSGNQVGWEPGVDFEDSPWHIVMDALPIDKVQGLPNFIKAKDDLTADAQAFEVLNSQRRADRGKLVMVMEYLERPSAKYPNGRRVVMANDRLILPVEDYPCAAYGYDGPCLHQLTYTVDPEADRDRGLVYHLLDAQRTYNNATNQQISWAQLALNPQIIGPPMANKVQFTDEPGAYYTVIPVNGMTPQWRNVPPIPPELAQMKEEAKMDMQDIAAANDVPSGVESGRAIQSLIEKDQLRWQSFLVDLADFHASLMRHCLMLVQRYYTEPRLMKVRGRFGPELIEDFKGADLCAQCDVMVFPGSLEPRTRQSIETKVYAYADRGWISPTAAMAAIAGGTAEKLVESYELDVARANRIIQKIKAGPEVLFQEPLVDPTVPPSWAPRKFDNIAVHKAIFEDWMKTQDYDYAPIEVQTAAQLYYEALLYLEAEKAAEAAQQQTAMAEQLGMENAARPQGASELPSQTKPELQGAHGAEGGPPPAA